MSKLLIGFDIGGTKCASVLGRFDSDKMKIVSRKSFLTKETRSPQATINLLEKNIRLQLIEHGSSLKDVVGLGISCGGPLDSRSGRVLGPPNLPGWDDVPIVEWCEKQLGIKTRLMNDANACALAEWRWGAGLGCEHMVFLTFGTGMGAGLILNGRLYEGACDLAGEVGHIRLADDGPTGYGKAGSFEGFCSGGGMAMAMRQQLAQPNLDCSANDIFERAQQGDDDAKKVVEQTAKYLGRGLAMLVDMLNVQRIVLGSIFTRRREMLWPIAKKVLEAEALPAGVKACEILPATLGESLGDFAALAAGTLADQAASSDEKV